MGMTKTERFIVAVAPFMNKAHEEALLEDAERRTGSKSPAEHKGTQVIDLMAELKRSRIVSEAPRTERCAACRGTGYVTKEEV